MMMMMMMRMMMMVMMKCLNVNVLSDLKLKEGLEYREGSND
jgi:hypothetical protein